MDIKVMFKATALVLALGGMGFSGSALAADVTLKISGTVKASPCKLDLGVSGPGSQTKLVKLNNGNAIEAADLADPQSHVGDTEFDIKLIGCPAATTSVTATFNGEGSLENPKMYKNVGTANAVQIELQDDAGANLGPNEKKTVNVIPAAGGTGTAEFKLMARAFSHHGGVTPGNIDGAVEIGFAYN